MKLEINIADQAEILTAIELLKKLAAPTMTDEEADAKVVMKAAALEPAPIVVAAEEQHEIETEVVEEAPPVEDGKTYSVEELREALAGFTATKGTAAAIELLKSFGASRISALAPEHHSAFMRAIA